jgi:hypothetical protein
VTPRPPHKTERRVKIGRNDLCPCGSGKKFKHCHIGRETSIVKPSHQPQRLLTLLDRNKIILNAASEIFKFSKGRDWATFKQQISGKEIREFYEVHAALWTPDTNWVELAPKPDGKLRALYLGDIRPEHILRNLIRFSLYSDELMVINPLMSPWFIKPKYNPIDNPDQYKADTLKIIYFLHKVEPWIRAGVVTLIPDPGDLNIRFKWEAAGLAQQRRGSRSPHVDDLAEGREHGREDAMRTIRALPRETLLRLVEKSGAKLSDEQKDMFVAHTKQQLRDDPLALEQPPGSSIEGGQMMSFRGGTNLETALLISEITGAFPYTNLRTHWEDLLSAHDELSESARRWSPFAEAFRSLDFRFLENIDPRFVQRLREEERLGQFRSLLRKIGTGASDVTDLNQLDDYVRSCKDELISEHKKAEAEWDKIGEDVVKWVGGSALGGLIVGGQLNPSMAAIAATTAAGITQLGLRYFKRAQFRKTNAMSVFIDLAAKDRPGTVTLF